MEYLKDIAEDTWYNFYCKTVCRGRYYASNDLNSIMKSAFKDAVVKHLGLQSYISRYRFIEFYSQDQDTFTILSRHCGYKELCDKLVEQLLHTRKDMKMQAVRSVGEQIKEQDLNYALSSSYLQSIENIKF